MNKSNQRRNFTMGHLLQNIRITALRLQEMPMNQRQLRKTIASFSAKKFDSTTELLRHVITQIVEHAGIDITGGRAWRLSASDFSYELIAQVGSVQQIKDHYKLRADKYALFTLLPRQRTVVLAGDRLPISASRASSSIPPRAWAISSG